MMLEGKRVVVTGGTGSLGYALVRRMLSGVLGTPDRVVVMSRDEAKQHAMRLLLMNLKAPTDDVIFQSIRERVRFQIGDVADYASVCTALRDADVVFHAAALKQVPTCEYFPFQTVKTNVIGAQNVVRAIQEHSLDVETVVSVSTDKACKPVNVMGMTKALQERMFVQANLGSHGTRFVVARYGNVLASRGSVVPLFHEQIRAGGPVTVTSQEMTRFLMSLDDAVDTVLAAAERARPGETYIPKLSAARIVDVAQALIGDREIETRVTGVRPGEKTHEILVSEEEGYRTIDVGDHYAILPMLPELREEPADTPIGREYSSGDVVLQPGAVRELLQTHALLVEDEPRFTELLTP